MHVKAVRPVTNPLFLIPFTSWCSLMHSNTVILHPKSALANCRTDGPYRKRRLLSGLQEPTICDPGASSSSFVSHQTFFWKPSPIRILEIVYFVCQPRFDHGSPGTSWHLKMSYVSLKSVTRWLNYLPGWVAHYTLEDVSIGFWSLCSTWSRKISSLTGAVLPVIIELAFEGINNVSER